MPDIKQPYNEIEIEKVLSEHFEWYGAIIRKVFYVDSFEDFSPVKKPSSFLLWLQAALDTKEANTEQLNKLSGIYDELIETADLIVGKSLAEKNKPTLHDYDKFKTLFEEFLSRIRRLQIDHIKKDSGTDLITGLRHKSIMPSDLAREMERLNRSGKPLSICVLRVDHLSGLEGQIPENVLQGYLRLVADIINISLRTFDDAYYIGDNIFSILLKQSDLNGSLSALARISELIEEKEISINSDTDTQKLSLTGVVGELVPNDNAEQVYESLRKSLDEKDEKHGQVFQYSEISALEKYIQSKG